MKSWRMLLAFVLIGFGLLFGQVVRQSELNAVDVLEDAMLAGGERLGAAVLPDLGAGRPRLEAEIGLVASSLGCRIRLFSAAGQLLADSARESAEASPALFSRPEMVAALAGGYQPFVGSGRAAEPSPGLFVAVPVVQAGRLAAIVYLTHPTAPLLSDLETIRGFAVKGMVGLTLLVALWAAWISGRLQSLLQQLMQLNQQVRQGVPLPVLEGHETAPIAAGYNRLLTELQDKVALLEEEKSKNQRFLQDLAHYLKTPLTGMAGSIEAVQGAQLADPALNRLLQRVGSETGRLSRLISQLLDLERLGYSPLRPEAFEFGSLVEVTMGHLEAVAARRGIRLVLADEEPLPVLGDADKIRTVVQNLLDNAVRCSPDGGEVVVGWKRGPECVRVEILDQGPGVTEEEQASIFERFSGGRASGGSMGLGLAIAREVITAHGQSIGVVLREGGGCCFFFTLALSPAQET